MISAAAFEFLRALAANNERRGSRRTAATYESAVREPVAALVASVATELIRRGFPLDGDPKRSMFRLHRDTRFSKDKRPYKTAIGAVWFRQGSGKGGAGVLYFHLDPAGCFAAAAFWHPEPEVLDSIRERIRVHPDQFLAMVEQLRRAKLGFSEDEMLSRMPKGFEDLKGSPVEIALRLKHFIVRRDLSAKAVQGKGLADKIADLAEEAAPLLRFGWDAVDEVARA